MFPDSMWSLTASSYAFSHFLSILLPTVLPVVIILFSFGYLTHQVTMCFHQNYWLHVKNPTFHSLPYFPHG